MSGVDMSTAFAVAIDEWQEATIDVLQEGACLAASPISADVREAEIVRPMEVIRADLIRCLSSQSEARRAHHALGLQALAATLNSVAFEIENPELGGDQ